MVGILFLITGFALIGLFALAVTKSDYLNPTVITPLMFLACSGATLYNYLLVGSEVSTVASFLLLITTIAFCVAAFFSNKVVVGRTTKGRDWFPSPDIIEVPCWLFISSIVICCIGALLYYKSVTQSFLSLGLSGDWNQMMNTYRLKTSFKELSDGDGISGPVNFLYKIMTAIVFVFSYIGINNAILSPHKKTLYLPLFLPAIAYCICTVFTGGRMGLIRYVLGCAVIAWILFNAKTGWTHRIKMSTPFKGLLLIAIASIIFWLLGTATGRQIQSGPFDYIASYIGYSMTLFSDFLKNPGTSVNNLFGGETFVGLYNFLGKHFGIEEYVYTYHMEWRYLGDISLGNVYTAYRYWIHDFGIVGMLCIATLYGIFYGICYTKARCYRNTSHRILNYPLLMFSYIAYGMFLLPIRDCLLATELVVTTPLILSLMYCLGRYVESKQHFSIAPSMTLFPRHTQNSIASESYSYRPTCSKHI